MVNWRKPLIFFGLKLFRNSITKNFEKIHNMENRREKIENFHKKNLKKLLKHCHENVPYYTKKLEDVGVIKNSKVNIENFGNIPILKKEDIQSNFNSLKSKDLATRNTYKNSTGGSTGKPLTFIQDGKYDAWNYANKLYHAEIAGKEVGEPEIKLWGSERDILGERRSVKKRIRNFLYNRTLLNSFKMSEKDMREYVEKWNSVKPGHVWAYVDSAYELGKFIEKEDLNIYSPDSIITTAGTLNEKIREFIEEIFGTVVLNQYGAREVGDMAVECPEQDGLHIFEHTHHLEVINGKNRQVKGETGNIIATNLHNYSMPLLRYKIEDIGIITQNKCSCSKKFKTLDKIEGRIVNHFKTKEGDIIHGEYFTHLFYFRPWVRKFKVIQEDFEKIRIEIENWEKPSEGELKDITKKIKTVLGEDCEVEFNLKETLEPSDSGKFLFTKSKVR
ncbi:hypothetical protein AKJ54_00350 [candidate division MSBL1 archaeon SCGC-AAA382K21]|uniref:AMP-dependent synthetase/ligase domain-containing protein n=1 Tax=candidate division MSBL1 archaeon SCGC-AAA382K21 TaxID=1698283 RepID=A0A133VLS2_9EURY|nr:hypothetical protein AKJ54_00350 [candidate division MSBL1 archaeon SCGC-AAA382K21]